MKRANASQLSLASVLPATPPRNTPKLTAHRPGKLAEFPPQLPVAAPATGLSTPLNAPRRIGGRMADLKQLELVDLALAEWNDAEAIAPLR